MGTRLNWQTTPSRRQLEQVSTPDSELASQRTYVTNDVRSLSRVASRRWKKKACCGYLLAPALITSPGDLGSLPSSTLVSIAQVVVGVDTHLLAGGELEHVLLLMLVGRRRAAHISTTRIGGAQDHRLTMVDSIAGAIGEAGARGFARQLGGQEFVGGQLAVVVLHGALAHLRRVGGGVGRGRRHIGVLA